jgi:enamine deaminase RidA (YjgF/YER057c/UK114 family)
VEPVRHSFRRSPDGDRSRVSASHRQARPHMPVIGVPELLEPAKRVEIEATAMLPPG